MNFEAPEIVLFHWVLRVFNGLASRACLSVIPRMRRLCPLVTIHGWSCTAWPVVRLAEQKLANNDLLFSGLIAKTGSTCPAELGSLVAVHPLIASQGSSACLFVAQGHESSQTLVPVLTRCRTVSGGAKYIHCLSVSVSLGLPGGIDFGTNLRK